jgi:DNA helicase-2/ATP-dependent DNA helicase PcrA
MRRLYLSHAWSRVLFGTTQYNPPSRFFDEIPEELIESKGNVSGRSSSGRQSYRSRDERAYDEPPPYRRGGRSGGVGGGTGSRDAEEHRERVVEAALRAGRSARPTPSDAHDLGLKVGDDVEHPAFGEGVILDIVGAGEKAEATVHFAGVGTKHLALAWAPLRKR